MKTSTLFLFLTLLFSQCIKDDNCCTCEVSYSESGSGTMGCLMDSSPWSPCNFAHEELKGNVTVYRDNADGRDFWWIKCEKVFNGGLEAVDIYLWYPKKGLIPNKKSGTFSSYGSMGAGFETQNAKYSGNYLKDTLEHYSLEITKFDTINKIISGRFECTLRNIGSEIDTAKIKITNGVFDTHY